MDHQNPCDYLQNTKIMYMDWNCYGGRDMKQALLACGIEVSLYPFDPRTGRNAPAFEKDFGFAIRSFSPQFVFSFNYFPVISKVCNEQGITYVSWVYDNPLVSLYSYTLANPCNRVFLFDRQEYLFFRDNGIRTVRYLPLAAAPERLKSDLSSELVTQKYTADISFIGSLYTEPKHQLYQRIKDLPDRTRGYLDAIMQAQKQVYGASFLEELLTEEVLSDLHRAYPCPPNSDGVETESYLYSNYFLLRHVTAMERTELIWEICQKHPLQLYTNDASYACPGCVNHGPADYYNESPYIFRHSRINLNITLRSIKSGIPLRAFDIMGSRGFLLTNYQEDFTDYFTSGQDYVYYTDAEDLMDKIDYYLCHEKERAAVAQAGYEEVLRHHTYEHRIPVLFGE